MESKKVEQQQPLQFWQVGDLVTITHSSEPGVKALIYEVYDRKQLNQYGISLISADGRDLGGWEPETWKFLQYSHNTGLQYEFESASQLSRDYRKGLLTPYFEIL